MEDVRLISFLPLRNSLLEEDGVSISLSLGTNAACEVEILSFGTVCAIVTSGGRLSLDRLLLGGIRRAWRIQDDVVVVERSSIDLIADLGRCGF